MTHRPSAPLFLVLILFVTASAGAAGLPTVPASTLPSTAAAPSTANLHTAHTPPPELLTIRRTVREVHVLFTVTDQHNRPVHDLSREQVTVLDSARPVEIVAFDRDSDLPLRLGVLIDTSASVARQFGLEQRAAEQFLRRVLRPDHDRAFVMSFNTHARTQQEETGDIGRLTAAIQAVAPEAGLTSLYDTVVDACYGLQPGREVRRRAIVLLSDGEDNLSMHGLWDTIEVAQRADIAVYAISIHDGSRRNGDLIMERLATATGGLSFVVSKRGQFESAFAAIEEELRSRYSIAYKADDVQPDGAFHAIRVRITAPGAYKVHARSGYWAPRN